MTTFVGTSSLLIVLPKAFRTFRVSPFQNSMEHRASWKGEASNRRSMRWSIDFQGVLHHRVGAAVWMRHGFVRCTGFTEWQKSSWENVKQELSQKLLPNPDSGWSRFFCLKPNHFFKPLLWCPPVSCCSGCFKVATKGTRQWWDAVRWSGNVGQRCVVSGFRWLSAINCWFFFEMLNNCFKRRETEVGPIWCWKRARFFPLG